MSSMTGADASPAQQAMYFVQQLAPGSHAYNVGVAGRTRARVDVEALTRALQALWERHSQLRATFELGAHGVRQRVATDGAVAFQRRAVEGLSEQELEARVLAEARRPFDLRSGPLFRATLFSRAEEDHVLLLGLHHLVTDLWSLATLLEELGTLYAAFRQGLEPALPPAGREYSELMAEQEARLAGREGERLRSYWMEQLAGELVPVPLPMAAPRPAQRALRGATVSFRLEEALTSRLRALAEAEGSLPLFLPLMAAFQVLLHRVSGQEDVLVSTPVHGRDRRELRGVVGLFLNPVPLRSRLSGGLSFREVLRRLQLTLRGALRHWSFPFHRLAELKGASARTALAQAQFVFQSLGRSDDDTVGPFIAGQPGARLPCGGLELEALYLPLEEGQFELQLIAYPVGGALSCQLKYDTELFEAATAEALATAYVAVLEAAAREPERRLEDFSVQLPSRPATGASSEVQVEAMSDEEVDAMLKQLVSAQQGRE